MVQPFLSYHIVKKALSYFISFLIATAVRVFSEQLTQVIFFTLTHSNEATKMILVVSQADCFTCFFFFFSFVLWLYLFYLIKYKLLVFIMKAALSPLQHHFSFLVQYQVPSASTWWIMPTFILDVFNFQTSAFTLSLGQPSNTLGRCPPQTSAKPLHWSPSLSLCCTAYSERACGPTICLLLLWL